jgi:hypothetical protein
MEKPDIIAALQDPLFFGQAFPDLDSFTCWQIILKAIFAIEMSEEEREVFEYLTGRHHPNPEGHKRIFLLAGRRSGKSRLSSTIAVYLAIFHDWQRYLAPGEVAHVFVVAVDRFQAGACLNYIKGLLEQAAPDLIEKVTSDSVVLTNRVTVDVRACNFKTGRGHACAAIIADEIGYWSDDSGANPAKEVINSLLPTLLPGGMLIAASTPRQRWGYLFEQFEAHWGKQDDPVLILRGETSILNPTYSQDTINELIASDPAFRAEYLCEWRSDLEQWLPREILLLASTGPALSLPDPAHRPYFCGIDPSGGGHDSYAAAICHVSGEQIIVDRVEERFSPLDPAVVTEEFATIMKAYGVKRTKSDRYAGMWPTSAYAKHGVVVEINDQSASELLLELGALIRMGRVVLPESDRLLTQLTQLERKVRSGGHDVVEAPTGGYDDLACALASAVVEAARGRVWTLEEQNARLPSIGHHASERVMSPDMAAARRKSEANRSCTDLMDDFLHEDGQHASRIIRR